MSLKRSEMAARERSLTEFLQHSGTVLAEAGEQEIVLRRRDGEDLVLRPRGQSDALSTVTQAFAQVVLGGELDRASAILPWLAFLAAEDRKACLHELAEVASAALATGRPARLEETLYQWQATGLAAWDERRLRERGDTDVYTRDEPLPIARPGR
jgi:hypothetical protein